MRLSDLKTGESAIIARVQGDGAFRQRIVEMGFVCGKRVEVILHAPLQDPIVYRVMGYEVSLRHNEAKLIEVVSVEEAKKLPHKNSWFACTGCDSCPSCDICNPSPAQAMPSASTPGGDSIIRVALVGNPNSGKTSLFNALCGTHEHVGNYSGVTVGAKIGYAKRGDYKIEITDLPGTYALTAYTPEERFVRAHLVENTPDVVLNVVAASNLERNLYLTTELIDLNLRTVVALNMYDELEASGGKLDHESLGGMMGIPMVPTEARNHKGINELLDTIVGVYEDRDERVRHVHIHGLDEIKPPGVLVSEGDIAWAGADRKYGFIAGALHETYTPGTNDSMKKSYWIDTIVTHRFWGFPIFFALMGLMFWCTFALGAYPMEWIESGVAWLSEALAGALPEGFVRDLLVDGVIAGVGGVIVFLPNILILYLFIAFFEDSGYMARAAFIMDRVMHRIGLHGKSFIPMVMGFGCNVPAIMATRTIESRSSRLITVLLIPFMSCSARMPIYILLIGTFFSAYGGWIMLGLYVLGIVMAILTSLALRTFLFKKDETPFVMELPPYRVPTARATARHTWDRAGEYLKKMGGIILVASVIVWATSTYPKQEPLLEQVGKFCEPAVEPLGLNWKAGVAIISGIPAKELVVSTLAVLYSGDESDEKVSEKLVASGDFTPASIIALLIFILLYVPCIAAVAAIARELSWKWALVSMAYNTLIAWLLAFAAYRIFS